MDNTEFSILIGMLIIVTIFGMLIGFNLTKNDKFIGKCEAYQGKVIDSICIKDNKVLFYNK